MNEFSNEEKRKKTHDLSWESAVRPALLERLMRPLSGGGVIEGKLAHGIYSRLERTRNLHPLTARFLDRTSSNLPSSNPSNSSSSLRVFARRRGSNIARSPIGKPSDLEEVSENSSSDRRSVISDDSSSDRLNTISERRSRSPSDFLSRKTDKISSDATVENLNSQSSNSQDLQNTSAAIAESSTAPNLTQPLESLPIVRPRSHCGSRSLVRSGNSDGSAESSYVSRLPVLPNKKLSETQSFSNETRQVVRASGVRENSYLTQIREKVNTNYSNFVSNSNSEVTSTNPEDSIAISQTYSDLPVVSPQKNEKLSRSYYSNRRESDPQNLLPQASVFDRSNSQNKHSAIVRAIDAKPTTSLIGDRLQQNRAIESLPSETIARTRSQKRQSHSVSRQFNPSGFIPSVRARKQPLKTGRSRPERELTAGRSTETLVNLTGQTRSLASQARRTYVSAKAGLPSRSTPNSSTSRSSVFRASEREPISDRSNRSETIRASPSHSNSASLETSEVNAIERDHNIDDIADKVLRKLRRDLIIERERRGQF
ncbi:hypothetical protein POG22_06170 [Geitlerinema sp. CS-897]|nr:hypothetical protein [Geitlerinema sp. CS-897]